MLRSDSGMVIAYLKKLFRQLPNTTTRHVILNDVQNLVAKGCKTLRFTQGDIDRSRSDAVQDEVSL